MGAFCFGAADQLALNSVSVREIRADGAWQVHEHGQPRWASRVNFIPQWVRSEDILDLLVIFQLLYV